ncbi:MAG: tRNA (adenosine(37)-N6)-threonylcarbamoyltransferase complex dimerization subunit type 1 TsaB [Pirellulales bacterium]|nr:tRNA (adenosine(37)-N6)-threonylcarbamoyltransferase complex dimerization subunit type 1 TsaB [Pirellulales bacterium]
MKTLAIETTGRTGSVALLLSGDCVAERRLPAEARSAQSLTLCIKELFDREGWSPQEIDLVAVTRGPGSFTGLRIGIVTAKTIAYAVSAAIVGVNSLRALAAAAGGATPIWCVMDAQRDECYAAKFFPEEEEKPLREIETTTILAVDDWMKRLTPNDRVVGPLLTKLTDRLPKNVECLGEEFWMPRAGIVGQLAVEKFRDGEQEDIWQFVPDYYRKSAAEEKLIAP